MSLATGTRLGPYEILGSIGAGGMGEVYRARDTRLDRDVAVKVMPASVAGDADRRARFEREARSVATLSHPNILAIFDTGVHDGQLYAVTELLEGETLRARLAQGPLATRKAIEVGAQIARGLAAAHDKGLVHRDLKPENVFLLHDGQVKILDFGLARQIEAGSESSPTVTGGALTDPGSVMGTVGYMAPEQIRAQAVDARTDLFAFGAVLYEMLSGRRAFQRDTAAETMTAILREDPPDLSLGRTDLPPALDRIVRHCLEKSPAERFQSARDVAFALEAFSGTNASGISGVVPRIDPPRRSWLRAAAWPVAVAAALAAGVLADRATRARPSPVTFDTKTWDSEWITNARFAPDGQTIVFSAAPDGSVPRLFAIRSGTVTSQPIGDAGVHLLSVSSTGELAVLTGAQSVGHRLFIGTLARMTMDSAPRPWMEHVSEADWSPDGSTLALTRVTEGRYRIEYPIGKVLYEAPTGYASDLRVSPDGARVAFFDHQFSGDDRGWVKTVDASGTVKTLAGEYWGLEGLAWSRDSRTVYFSGSARGGEAFEPLAVNVSGTPNVRQAFASAGAMLVQDVAKDGRLLVMRDDLRGSIRALIPGDAAEREFPWLDFAYQAYLSGDHKFLVFGDESQNAGANYAVGLRDVASGRVVRLGEGQLLGLSPDDKWAGALVPSTDEMVLYPIGPGDPIKLPKGPIRNYGSNVLQWLPDGRHVILCGTESGGMRRCYMQDPSGGGPPTPIGPPNTTSVRVSGDGRMLCRLTTGAYVIAPAGGGDPAPAKGILANDFAFAWARDGKSIFVQSGSAIPTPIDRVDPWTGTRTHVMDMAPPDRAGVNVVVASQWIDDGRGYVYSYFRELTRLFVASGVQ